MLRNGNKYILMLVSIIMLTACISQSRTSFIPPQDRESLLAEQPWPHNGFVAISWHNVEDEAADQRFMSVRTSALREQFAWLRENGYQPVSIAQIREAHRGGKRLPEFLYPRLPNSSGLPVACCMGPRRQLGRYASG